MYITMYNYSTMLKVEMFILLLIFYDVHTNKNTNKNRIRVQDCNKDRKLQIIY